MANWDLTLTLRLEFGAGSEEQANERAEEIAAAAMNGVQSMKARWERGDIDYDTTVEKGEG